MKIEKGIYLARDETGIPLLFADELMKQFAQFSEKLVVFYFSLCLFLCVSGKRLSCLQQNNLMSFLHLCMLKIPF